MTFRRASLAARIVTAFVFIECSAQNNTEPTSPAAMRLVSAAYSTILAGLRITLDLPYGADSLQRLDLYRPTTCPATGCPVVVWLHGNHGDKALADSAYQLQLPVWRGIALVSCNFRTDPVTGDADATTLADARQCRIWVTGHATNWQLDGSRVACWGSSLGGYLCNGLLQRCSAPQACVRGGVSLFGASDLLHFAKDIVHAGCPKPQPTPYDSARAWQASPVRYVAPASPPWMGLHSLEDCTVAAAQSIRLDSAYRASGAVSRLRLYSGLGHGGPEWSADSIVDPQLKFLEMVVR